MPGKICPNCKKNEVTGTWAVVDKNTGAVLVNGGERCDVCGQDLASLCDSHKEVKKVK